MKREKAIELYSVLNECKLSGMGGGAKVAVLETLRELRPVAEGFDRDMETAREKLRPEGYDETERKALAHNEAVSAGNDGGRLSPDELREVATALTAYKADLEAAARAMLEGEVDVSPRKLDGKDMEALLAANDAYLRVAEGDISLDWQGTAVTVAVESNTS